MKFFSLSIFLCLYFSISFSQSDKINIDSNFSFLKNSLDMKNQLQSDLLMHKSLNVIKPNILENRIDYTLLSGIGTTYLGTGLIIHYYQQNAWWKDQRSSFHFLNDWEYALYIDKIGHFYGASLLQHAFSSALEASGFEAEPSTIYGAIGSLLFQLYVEIEDGFGPQWGFSPGDAYSDLLGSAFPVAQFYFPVLKNYQLRFSYLPAKLNEINTASGQQHIIIDDYEGQKFWLSVKVKELLPNSFSKHLPGFLMLAVGMGVKELDGSGGGKQDFYVALDFDYDAIPLYGKGWQFIKNTLSFIHFPMPAIRINNGVAFFGFCF